MREKKCGKHCHRQTRAGTKEKVLEVGNGAWGSPDLTQFSVLYHSGGSREQERASALCGGLADVLSFGRLLCLTRFGLF